MMNLFSGARDFDCDTSKCFGYVLSFEYNDRRRIVPVDFAQEWALRQIAQRLSHTAQAVQWSSNEIRKQSRKSWFLASISC